MKQLDTNSTSSISTAAVQSIFDTLKNHNTRSSTDKVYYQIWKSFNQFFIKLDTKPKTWEERIVLYVGYLIANNRKSGTICSYLSGIRSVLKKDGVQLNEDKTLLSSLTKACKLKNDRVLTRLPIRKSLIELLIKKIPELYTRAPQPYLTSMYKAIFITAYYRLFRIGELTMSEHAVKGSDVHIGINKDKLLFLLRTSKIHSLDAKPQIIKIESLCSQCQRNSFRNTTTCPLKALQDFMQLRKVVRSRKEQFFVFKGPHTGAAQTR